MDALGSVEINKYYAQSDTYKVVVTTSGPGGPSFDSDPFTVTVVCHTSSNVLTPHSNWKSVQYRVIQDPGADMSYFAHQF